MMVYKIEFYATYLKYKYSFFYFEQKLDLELDPDPIFSSSPDPKKTISDPNPC